jgi:hypothetical protein
MSRSCEQLQARRYTIGASARMLGKKALERRGASGRCQRVSRSQRDSFAGVVERAFEQTQRGRIVERRDCKNEVATLRIGKVAERVEQHVGLAFGPAASARVGQRRDRGDQNCENE